MCPSVAADHIPDAKAASALSHNPNGASLTLSGVTPEMIEAEDVYKMSMAIVFVIT